MRLVSKAAVLMLAGASVALAEPGLGVKWESWTLIPYVDTAMTYDSNIHQTRRQPKDDTYFDLESGLRFSRMTGPALPVFDGSLFYLRRTGAADDGDFNTFGDALRLRQAGDGPWRYEFTQNYRRVQAVDQHANDFQSGGVDSDIGGPSSDMVQDIHTLSQQRDVHQVGVGAECSLTDKIDAGLAYRYAAVRYASGQFQDLDGHNAQVEGVYKITEKTSAFLSFRQGLQNQEGMDASSTYSVGRAGLKSRGTDKVIYKAGLGLMRHSRPSVEEGPQVTTEISYDVSADWRATQKILVQSGANNGIQMSAIYSGNALDYKSIWAGASWRPSTTWIASIRGSYRQDRYLDPVPADGRETDRVDDRADVQCRLDYVGFNDFYRVHAEVFPWWVNSTLRDLGYDEMRVIVGFSIRY